MAIAVVDHRDERANRNRPSEKPRELRTTSSVFLFAVILLGVAGWIGFEILLTLITLD